MKTIIALIFLSTVAAVAQTNAPPSAPDKIQTVLTLIDNWLNGALLIVTGLLSWYAVNRAKLAALVSPLIKSIETRGTPELKAEVKNRAGELGLQPAMQAAVDANTVSAKPLTPTPPATP